MRRVVDLPAPFGPRKPCTSPVATSRSSPSRARAVPKVLTRADTEMAVPGGGAAEGRAVAVVDAFMIWKLRSFHKFVKLRKR